MPRSRTRLPRSRTRRVVVAATLAASVTGVAAVLSPVSAAARTPSHPAASSAVAGTASILLINGDHALVSSAAGGHVTSILRPARATGLAGDVTSVRAGADTLLLPGAVRHGLRRFKRCR